LGAVYRIPLTRVLGDEGMGLFQMAHPVYAAILTISTVGINVAISKLLAGYLAQGMVGAARRTFHISLTLMATLGLVFSVLMFFTARPIALHVAHNPDAYYAIAALAPAIFIVSVASAFRGYFQGQQIMLPTAISQVAEQVVRVATMLLLAHYLLRASLPMAAAGATFGASAGAVAGLVALLVILYARREQPLLLEPCRLRDEPSASQITLSILRLAVPISLAGTVVSIINLIDLVVVPNRLIAIGFAPTDATRLYGQLTGMALTLVNMPTVFTSALQASLVPSVSEAQALRDEASIRARASIAIRVTLLMAIPATVGLYLLATPIADLLFGIPEAGAPIAAMSGGLLFLTLQQTTSGVLQGLGRTDLPVRHLLLGAVCKFVVSWTLTGMPAFGIRGAALGTTLGFMVAAILNLAVVKTLTGAGIAIGDTLVKPIAATAAMGLAAVMGYRYFFGLLASNGQATLIAIALAMSVYALVLLLSGGLRERDFELVPTVGPWLARWLKRRGALRR
jgi:stage V sporulation protein B